MKINDVYEKVKGLPQLWNREAGYIDFDCEVMCLTPELEPYDKVFAGWTMSLVFDDYDNYSGMEYKIQLNEPDVGWGYNDDMDDATRMACLSNLRSFVAQLNLLLGLYIKEPT